MTISTQLAHRSRFSRRGASTSHRTCRRNAARNSTRSATRSDLRRRCGQAHVHGVPGAIGVPVQMDVPRVLPDDEPLPCRALPLGGQPLQRNASAEREVRAPVQRASRVSRPSVRCALFVDHHQVGRALPRCDPVRGAQSGSCRALRRPCRLAVGPFPALQRGSSPAPDSSRRPGCGASSGAGSRAPSSTRRSSEHAFRWSPRRNGDCLGGRQARTWLRAWHVVQPDGEPLEVFVARPPAARGPYEATTRDLPHVDARLPEPLHERRRLGVSERKQPGEEDGQGLDEVDDRREEAAAGRRGGCPTAPPTSRVEARAPRASPVPCRSTTSPSRSVARPDAGRSSRPGRATAARSTRARRVRGCRGLGRRVRRSNGVQQSHFWPEIVEVVETAHVVGDRPDELRAVDEDRHAALLAELAERQYSAGRPRRARGRDQPRSWSDSRWRSGPDPGGRRRRAPRTPPRVQSRPKCSSVVVTISSSASRPRPRRTIPQPSVVDVV